MANGDIQDLLRSGIQAARNGNKAVARNIFEQILEIDRDNEVAWMWYASVLDAVDEREHALRQVLDINPDNTRAQQALARLRGSSVPAAAGSRGETDWQSLAREKLYRQYEARQQQGSTVGSLVYYLAAVLAIAMIGAGLYLFWQETQAQNGEQADVVTVTPTFFIQPTSTPIPPTNTPLPPGFTVVPLSEAENVELQPAWTPLPTATNQPTALPTATPLPVESYQLIYASSENSTAPRQLIFWDGANAQIIEFSLGNVTLASSGGSAETQEPSTVDQGQLEFLDPAFSPDGQQVAFTVQLAPNVQEIFVAPLDGGRAQQVTTLGAANTGGAAWSPDGERLAFASDADGDLEVYLIDLDGDNLTNLSNNLYEDRDPSFSPNPDNPMLVIASDRNTPGEFEIFAIPLGDGAPEQYTEAIGSSFSPAFSPDGQLIAFVSNRNGDNDLFVMNANGSNERLLSQNDGGANEFDPAWLPDGTRISVSSDRDPEPPEGSEVAAAPSAQDSAENLHIWLVSVTDSNDWQQLTFSAGFQRGASWRSIQ